VFNKLLIANRGEIACRVIRSARRLGIATVAVYSEADRHALHVEMADEALFIGNSPPGDSYLRGDAVIEAAIKAGAEAIHPGYGFLSENAAFARQCSEHRLTFIGPPVSAIEAMGSKSAAKRIMEQAEVPLVPGYHGDDQDPQVLRHAASAMGYPVLLKAVAGGGGKGMRIVEGEDEFDSALAAARREASKSFGDDNMLVERYLRQPRHVEIQVFCDGAGNGVYLFERDCSVQRRHQKIIEEAPAPNVDTDLRARMGETAVRAAQAIDYQGAGTVEFLLDSDGTFYFMEMNTRLQVEHPVTEMITGLDLVEWQLRVAAGEPLPLQQQQLTINGHAFEARIYAEDPANDFLPVSGTLSYLQAPTESAHVRIDTGVRQGDEVSVYYDPMIAKLVVWDEDRQRALQRLTTALADYRISGMTTNIDFLYNLASTSAFQQAQLDTGFIERHHDEIFQQRPQDLGRTLPLAALYLVLRQAEDAAAASSGGRDPWSPWNRANGWRLNEPHLHHFALLIQEQVCDVTIEQHGFGAARRYSICHEGVTVAASGKLEGNTLLADIEGHRLQASIAEHDGIYSLYTADCASQFSLVAPDLGDTSADTDQNHLTAPMNGTVVTLLVDRNTAVQKDEPLLVMEAMKMEHTIRAPANGKVMSFYFQAGELVDGGAQLLEFHADE
jgi:3-methylcrotonyl-CoA carboxylase alpha subunit